MAEGGVDDFRAFAVTLEDVGADLRVAAFGVVVGRFADVVQQAGAAGHVGIHLQFFRDRAGHKCHFDRVPQHVLAIAGAIVQAAQQVHDAFVQTADLRFLHGLLAEPANLLLDILLRFGDQLLDARRMDSAVGDELVECDAGNFAANRVERADDHHARRVVDDHVDAGRLFERTNVPPFAADDAAFHFVAGNIDGAGRGLGGMGGRKTLNRGEQDFFGFDIGNRGDLFFLFQDQRALLVRKLLIEPLEQAFLGFLGAEAADLMEGLPLGVEQIIELGLAAADVFDLFGELALVVFNHLLLFLDLLGARFEYILLLVEMALAFEGFLASFVELVFDARFFAQRHFLGFNLGFFVPGGRLDFGFFKDLAGFLFGIVLAQITDELDDGHSHQGGTNGDQNNRPRTRAFFGSRKDEHANVGQHGRNSLIVKFAEAAGQRPMDVVRLPRERMGADWQQNGNAADRKERTGVVAYRLVHGSAPVCACRASATSDAVQANQVQKLLRPGPIAASCWASGSEGEWSKLQQISDG